MFFIKLSNKKSIGRAVAALLCTAMILGTGLASAVVTNEQIVNSFTGAPNGQAVINNLRYTDINSAANSLKDAIYQNGALGIFPSQGNKTFNMNGTVTKEMALYLVYMAANRAQDIYTQGQALNNARAAANKKTNPQEVLYDGSLQLAANEGLISQQDLADALQTEQTTLLGTSFKRESAVQRQEFATWLAKALLIPPVYDNQDLYNNFSDWKSVNPDNVPYVEAILENSIMSGDGTGNFSPRATVTRQQAARILKNAENIILPIRTLEKRIATVEDIQYTKDTSKGYRTDSQILVVRNSDGLLDDITVEARYQVPATTTNELTTTLQPSYSTAIPVFNKGQITNSQSLKKGDRIEYIAGVDDRVVRYARVLSNTGEVSYIAAVVNSVNTAARTINLTPLKQTIEYPNEDISTIDKKTYSDGSILYDNYSYSNNVVNAMSKATINVGGIKPESIVIVGLNKEMIVELMPVTVKKERETGLVAGIVEENNPQLGYLTLYNEDGTGKTPLALSSLRTFNYADPNTVEVYKNHEAAALDDIEAGDTVFVRINDTGDIESISSVTNYTVRYGTVVSKKISSILVNTDKGQQTFGVDGINIIKDGKLSKYSQLKEGDRVKLLINEAPNITLLKELTIDPGNRLVSNVYKGVFEKYDDISDKMILSDPWTLQKGQWIKDTSGMRTIELGEDFTAYYDGKKQSIRNMNSLLAETTVYIVSQKDYGRGEYGVTASFVNELDKEVAYNDKVYNTATNRFVLEKGMDSISYNPGTIVVKDGRLVQGSSVAANDFAYVVANRDADTGKLVAGVVSIEARPGTEAVQLFRGRIVSIDEYKTVTLTSYSKLNRTAWNYANTPITFTLNADTRITDTDGIVGQGDFTSYNGTDTFKDRTIYILANGTNAVEISTAPFGSFVVSGIVKSTTGGTVGEDGSQVQQPDSVELRNCKYYNPSTYLWVTMNDSSFDFIENSLVIKNNQRIMPSELKKGDKLQVFKKDNATTGDAYIVIVEE